MKKTGFILLQISAVLILVGGIGDLTMTFFLDSIPGSHFRYLNLKNEPPSLQLKNLDFALLRTIGACLVAIGIGAFTIIHSGVRHKINYTIPGLITMVTLAEGINFSQMLKVNSPYSLFPLICILIMWAGAMLWWFGNKANKN
ncbi:MAG: hypothetical protein EKK37_15930 [Sphingobacteriales bacterium]|nr:MAG: hypothetical protein EKK37_15930 [Sphingobacteriales bacterium]